MLYHNKKASLLKFCYLVLWLCYQPSDPFGTGLFVPAGGTSALHLPSRSMTASEPPQLPPKQHKRAPAPPRPPAPKPAGGSVPGGLDVFESNDPFARGHRTGSGSASSKKSDAFAKFAEASPGRVSIDAENSCMLIFAGKTDICFIVLAVTKHTH